MISGVLNKLNNENESILENTETHGLHKDVWKNLLEKVELVNNSMDSNVFSEIVRTVSINRTNILYFLKTEHFHINQACS